jgi:hypothetical protein
MDHDLVKSISKALKKLQQEQTVLSNKLIKIAEVCKNKFANEEREQAEKHAYYENKLDDNLKLNEEPLYKIEKKSVHDSVENELRSECIKILQDENFKLDVVIKKQISR